MPGVVFICGSQMSKTDGVVLNTIGWQFDDDPRPILYIGPTKKNAESVSADRISKMIRTVPSLYAGLAKGQKDKTAEKFIHGVRLGVAWAGSATELASHPAAKVFVDERDRMEDIKGEGDVNTLAEARVATYDGIVITTSTPTLGSVETELLETGLEHWKPADAEDIQSPSWKLWQEGSRHEWAWPCAHCREYYIPRFKLLVWPKDATPTQAYQDASVVCPHCGTETADADKEWMNDHAVFVAPGQRPEACGDDDVCATIVDGEVVAEVPYGDFLEPQNAPYDTLSFWASGLCSNWRTFGHRARGFLRALESGEPGRVQAARNTGFGELYRPRTSTPDWQVVANLREPYHFDDLPEWAQVLTCSVDVQARMLIYSVRAWGAAGRNAQIRHGEIHGATKFDEPWEKLGELLERRWEDLMITRMLVDSGFNPSKSLSGSVDDEKIPTNKVYEFCRRHRGRAMAVKAHDTLTKPIRPAQIDINVGGRILKNGLTLWHVDSDFFKSEVYDWIELDPADPGRFRLSEDTTDDYCMQLVAEARTVKPSGKVEWVKIRKDNHYLDCEMMNAAAAHLLQLNLLTEETRAKYRTGKPPEPPGGGGGGNRSIEDLANQLNG